MEYYSTILKKEILSFATTWMDLEGIMLGETRQRETNAIWFHLFVELKTNQANKAKTDSQKQRPKGWLPELSGGGRMGVKGKGKISLCDKFTQ